MSRSVWAIVAGGVADIVGTNIASIPLVVAAMMSVDVTLPLEQLTSAIVAAMRASPALFVLSFVFGASCGVMGGYVAAWIARRRHIFHGALSASLCVAIGFYSLVASADRRSMWFQLVLLLLSPVLGGLGGFLRERHMEGSVLHAPQAIQPELTAT